MTTWIELRTVALVGTERRTLPEPTGQLAALLPTTPSGQSAEQRTLTLAALLGVARRAAIAPGSSPAPVAPDPGPGDAGSPPDREAPAEAVQLLELMFGGNAGPGRLDDSLLERWFTRCAEHELVVPHRLLVAVLDLGSTNAALRDRLVPTLGHRGRWLAEQRRPWAWATATGAQSSALTTDLAALLAMPAEQRAANLVAIRDDDAALGRELIGAALAELDASGRAKTIACLEPHLGAEDETLLEVALDDRSKLVRDHAIRMLSRLPASARARRLAACLDPLVTKSGRLRTTIHVAFPAPPTDEQARDLPSSGDRNAVVEQQWFDALIAGTPLGWWATHLAMSPDEIVGARLDPSDELLAVWTAAALAQRNADWAAALYRRTKDANLLTLAGGATAERAFLDSLGGDANPIHQSRALAAVPGPWSEPFSRRVVGWLAEGAGRSRVFTPAIAANLSTQVLLDLEAELERHRGDDDQTTARTIRNAIQHLSFRTSIDKAFADD